jgi:branched-chain amino acid transport system substrate-binding protein
MTVGDRSRITRLASSSAAVALLAATAAACAGAADSSKGSDEIAIAVGAPLSGQYARAGQETLNAVKIAVKQFNEEGGLDGKKVKVVQGDDQGDPQGGQTVAQKFCDDTSVVAVVGHYNSGVSIPASDVYQRCGLAEISPLSSNPELTERGLDNVFRVGARDDYMSPAVATFLADKTDLTQVSTIDDQSTYGVGLVQQFTKTATSKGLKIVKKAAIKAGDKDFRAVLGSLPKSTQVIYFGGYPSDAALLGKQAREVGLKVIIAGGDGLYDPDFLKGGEATEQAVLAGSAGIPNDAAKTFLDAYEADYGSPSGYGLLEYNSARLVLQALKDAKKPDRKGVITSLRGVSYEPIQGGSAIAFDEKGDNKNAEVHIFRVENGEFVEAAVLKPSDFS